ncbi:TPA: hypothetical protein HA246_06195 [Candidatus Woesearchaeota archaeon]|nr:hypothetical protein [Candidatus Woesearchaeota archaeon]
MNLRNPILLSTLLAVAGVSALPGSIIKPRAAFAQTPPAAQDESNMETATVSRFTDYFAPDLSGIGSKVTIAMPRNPQPGQDIYYDVGIEAIITPSSSAATESEFDFRIPIIEFAAAFPESMNVMDVELYVGNGEQLLKAEKIPGIDIAKGMTIAALLAGFGGEQAQKLMEYARIKFGETQLGAIDSAFSDDDPAARGRYDVTTMKIDASDYILPFRRVLLRFRVHTEDGYDPMVDLFKLWMVYGEQIRYTGLGKRDLSEKLLASRYMNARRMEVTSPVPFVLRNAGAVSGNGQQSSTGTSNTGITSTQSERSVSSQQTINCRFDGIPVNAELGARVDELWNMINSAYRENGTPITPELQRRIQEFFSNSAPSYSLFDTGLSLIEATTLNDGRRVLDMSLRQGGFHTSGTLYSIDYVLRNGRAVPIYPLGNRRVLVSSTEHFLMQIEPIAGTNLITTGKRERDVWVADKSGTVSTETRRFVTDITRPRIYAVKEGRQEFIEYIVFLDIYPDFHRQMTRAARNNGEDLEAPEWTAKVEHLRGQIKDLIAGNYSNLDEAYKTNGQVSQELVSLVRERRRIATDQVNGLPQASGYSLMDVSIVTEEKIAGQTIEEAKRRGTYERKERKCIGLWLKEGNTWRALR